MSVFVGSARKERNSGVEMLKVFAIILIIISHISQTLQQENNLVGISSYILDFSAASLNAKSISLQFMRSFGAFGNLIFFICSAWFLLGSDKVNAKKWLFMLIEVWSVSVIIAISFMLLKKESISRSLLIQSFLPTTFSNNWYLTCYLLFYPLHVFLNKMISQLEKRLHLKFIISAFILYYIIDFVLGAYFFYSDLLLWMVIYMFISYVKKYLPCYSSNRRLNLIIAIICTLLYLVLLLVSNIIGLRIDALSNFMLHWGVSNNPFLLITSICLFNIALNTKFSSRLINYISSLSLLIYIFHENILIRSYIRPIILEYIHLNWGYNLIVLWILILAVLIFLLSVVLSILYNLTLGKLLKKIADLLYEKFKIIYDKVEKKLLNMK